MITLSSTPSQMRLEMEQDLEKLQYWWRKSFNRKEYREAYLSANKRARETGEWQMVGEPHEWKSRNGNRWYYQNAVMREPISGEMRDSGLVFVYYETYGSVGAFVPSFDPMAGGMVMEDAPVVFTSHFFLRYCERMGLKMRSRDMVMAFINEQLRFDVKELRNDNGILEGISVQLQNGVGRGVVVNEGGNTTWEIRTFIPYKMLTRKQREEAVINYTFDPMDEKHKNWFMFLCRPLRLPPDTPHLDNIYVEGVGKDGWLQVGVTVLSSLDECRRRLDRKVTVEEMGRIVADERVGRLVRELALARDKKKPGFESPQNLRDIGTLTFDLSLAIADILLHKGWYSCRGFLEMVMRSRFETGGEPYHGECGIMIEEIGYKAHAKELGYEICDLSEWCPDDYIQEQSKR